MSLGFRKNFRHSVDSFLRRSYHAQDGDGSGAGLHGEATAAGGQTRHPGPGPGPEMSHHNTQVSTGPTVQSARPELVVLVSILGLCLH